MDSIENELYTKLYSEFHLKLDSLNRSELESVFHINVDRELWRVFRIEIGREIDQMIDNV
jgi:hypothetical protein